MSEWSTKQDDLKAARMIMEHYAMARNLDAVGFLELVVNSAEKRMNFRLADWIVHLALHFNTLYGADHGDYVTRQVVSLCMVQGETMH